MSWYHFGDWCLKEIGGFAGGLLIVNRQQPQNHHHHHWLMVSGICTSNILKTPSEIIKHQTRITKLQTIINHPENSIKIIKHQTHITKLHQTSNNHLKHPQNILNNQTSDSFFLPPFSTPVISCQDSAGPRSTSCTVRSCSDSEQKHTPPDVPMKKKT